MSILNGYFTLLDQKCVDEDIEKYLDNVDVVFFATPQGVCAKMVNENVLKKVKVIDLSADYRIKDVETYESWYGIKHASPEFIQEAVYGLCEIRFSADRYCNDCQYGDPADRISILPVKPKTM